jgi:hypothetical protein
MIPITTRSSRSVKAAAFRARSTIGTFSLVFGRRDTGYIIAWGVLLERLKNLESEN